MVRNGKMKFLGLSAFTGMLVVWSSMAGCQEGTSTSTSGDTSGGGEGGGVASTTSTGNNTGGDSSTSSASSMSSGSTGTGGSTAIAATIRDITHDPDSKNKIKDGSQVKLTGVVAMSQKFLISRSKAGACLWGVFVSEPNLAETKAYSGILALSYGTNASITGDSGIAYCPRLGIDPVGDAIPDDTKPGDVLDILGEADSFLLKDCAAQPNGSTVGQYQITKIPPNGGIIKTGTAPVPKAHKITAAELAQIGSPTDKAFHNMWGGVKLEITNVVSEPQDNNGVMSITDKFGRMLVHDVANATPTAADKVQVGNKLYYRGYAKSQNFCYDAPEYAVTTTTFTAMEGFHYLDFCTWNLQPNDKCADLAPPSPAAADCNSVATACEQK